MSALELVLVVVQLVGYLGILVGLGMAVVVAARHSSDAALTAKLLEACDELDVLERLEVEQHELPDGRTYLSTSRPITPSQALEIEARWHELEAARGE